MGMEVGAYYNSLYPDLLLKIEGFDRRRKADEVIMREIGWAAYTAPHLNVKKMHKDRQSFWPIDLGEQPKDPKDSLTEKRKRIAEALKKQREHGKA